MPGDKSNPESRKVLLQRGRVSLLCCLCADEQALCNKCRVVSARAGLLYWSATKAGSLSSLQSNKDLHMPLVIDMETRRTKQQTKHTDTSQMHSLV